MKMIQMIFRFVIAAVMISGTAIAGTKADIAKIESMVLQGYEVVNVLGEKAYDGFNIPTVNSYGKTKMVPKTTLA